MFRQTAAAQVTAAQLTASASPASLSPTAMAGTETGRSLPAILDEVLARAIDAMIATLFAAVVGAPVALLAFGWLTGAIAW